MDNAIPLLALRTHRRRITVRPRSECDAAQVDAFPGVHLSVESKRCMLASGARERTETAGWSAGLGQFCARQAWKISGSSEEKWIPAAGAEARGSGEYEAVWSPASVYRMAKGQSESPPDRSSGDGQVAKAN